MPVEIELWQLLVLLCTTPLAALGIVIIFKKFTEYMLVRKHYIKSMFFTGSRGIDIKYKKPENNTIIDGKRMYNFTPKRLFRDGNTPTILYNMDSVDPIDPTDVNSVLSSTELGAQQTLWYADGARDAIKKGDVVKILLMITLVAAAGACIMTVMLWQSMNAVEGHMISAINSLPDNIVAKLPQAAPSNITVLT